MQQLKSAAKQQIGEARKKRLAKRLAFFRFDNPFGIIKGEQPLIRASRASKVAGAFLVLFWHAKENLFPLQILLQLQPVILLKILQLLHQPLRPRRGVWVVLLGFDAVHDAHAAALGEHLGEVAG